MGKIFIFLIWLYQVTISSWMLPSCRYIPSCSQYAMTAIARHGIIRGFYLSFKRICRCHPWGGFGHDPVP